MDSNPDAELLLSLISVPPVSGWVFPAYTRRIRVYTALAHVFAQVKVCSSAAKRKQLVIL